MKQHLSNLRLAYSMLTPKQKRKMITSIAILLIILIAIFLFIGNATISVKPFSITVPDWHRSVGMIVLIAGIAIYNIGEYHKGFKAGYKAYGESLEQALNELQADKEAELEQQIDEQKATEQP